jgi:hypothetical protein
MVMNVAISTGRRRCEKGSPCSHRYGLLARRRQAPPCSPSSGATPASRVHSRRIPVGDKPVRQRSRAAPAGCHGKPIRTEWRNSESTDKNSAETDAHRNDGVPPDAFSALCGTETVPFETRRLPLVLDQRSAPFPARRRLCDERPRVSSAARKRLVICPVDVVVPACGTICGPDRRDPLMRARQA